jgi:arylsulfatase A-like enzyme
MTDQQRLDTIAARFTSFPAKTPASDKLFRHGAFFENAYCTAPICGPSRASIMTGLTPTQAGIHGNLGNPCSPLNESFRTCGVRLQERGYETVYHGKWHLGGNLNHYGFEVAYDNGHDPSTVTEACRFWRNRDWMVHKRPFFQVISLLNPHDIYFLDPEDETETGAPPWPNQNDDLSKKPWPQSKHHGHGWTPQRWEVYRQFYARKMEEADAHIGILIDELIDSGFGPNTWIILTTDHGDMAGEHGIPFKGPYMYEGVTHVPLLVIPPQERFSGKGKGQPSEASYQPRICRELVSHIDLLPTILDLAGAPADPTLPGKSLIPAVMGKPGSGHDAVFAEWHQWGKLVSPIRMIRTGDWKYNLYLKNGAELYNLKDDPGEINNLAGNPQFAAVEKDLRARLDEQIRKTRDPFYSYTPTDTAGEPYSVDSANPTQ